MQNLFEIYTKLPRECVVYKLIIGNKYYIGSTKDLKDRMKDHVGQLRRGVHYCKHLQRSFNKHGKCNLYIEILHKFSEIVPELVMFSKERDFIATFNKRSLFNGRLDPTTDYNCRTTSKKVHQYSLDGKFIKTFDSCRQAERTLNITGVSHAANPKMVAKSASGFRFSYKKYKILPNKYSNGSSLAKSKKVFVCKNDEFIGEFKSIADTARELFPNYGKFDSTCTCISSVILGKFKTYKGYTFKDRGEDT